MFNVKFSLDSTSAFNAPLDQVKAKSNNLSPFMKRWAVGVAKLAQACARKKTKGGRYWQQVASKIRASEIRRDSAIIRTPFKGSILHEFGGVVRPVEAKSLAIPVSPMARGKSPLRFKNLYYLPSKKSANSGLLARDIGRGKNKKIEVMYVLRKSVTIPINRWFPTGNAIHQVAIKEGRKFLKELQGN